MRGRHTERPKAQRGSASTELVILAPLLVILVSVCLIAGRLGLARQQIDDAARAASEAAVVSSSASAAAYAATVTATANILHDGLACEDESVKPDTAAFRAGGSVSVRVACTVPLSHLAFGGLPGSVRLSATRSAPIEPYRQLAP